MGGISKNRRCSFTEGQRVFSIDYERLSSQITRGPSQQKTRGSSFSQKFLVGFSFIEVQRAVLFHRVFFLRRPERSSSFIENLFFKEDQRVLLSTEDQMVFHRRPEWFIRRLLRGFLIDYERVSLHRRPEELLFQRRLMWNFPDQRASFIEILFFHRRPKRPSSSMEDKRGIFHIRQEGSSFFTEDQRDLLPQKTKAVFFEYKKYRAYFPKHQRTRMLSFIEE